MNDENFQKNDDNRSDNEEVCAFYLIKLINFYRMIKPNHCL